MTATLPPGTITLGYEPQKMQEVFHSCPADEALFGGSAGGGKSDALVNEFIHECATVPKTRAVLFRRTNPELQELKDRAEELLAPFPEIATFRAREERWEFPQTGSFLRFSHLQHYEDVHKHQGSQYSLLGFDEWTHFLPKQVEYLKSRNRSAHGLWVRTRGASNPGAIGHAYIKDYFVAPRDERGTLIDNVPLLAYYDFTLRRWVRTKPYEGQSVDVKELGKIAKWQGHYNSEKEQWEPCPPWDRGKPSAFVTWVPTLTEEERRINETRERDGVELLKPMSRCYIPARLKDNKYLYDDYSYHARLARLPENERKALLDGNWDIFEGAFFPDFRPAIHVIDGGWRPPANWSVWASMDWGRSVPSAVYWHAQNPENQHIATYREMYGIYRTDREIAENIVFLTGDEDVRYIMADPAMWRADGNDDAISHADTFDFYFANEGTRIKMMKADNNRVAGWARLKDLMAIDPKTITDDAPEGQPYWRCTADCRNLIRTIPQQVYDADRQDDLDTDGEDHGLDALRYGVMNAKSLAGRRSYNIRPAVIKR